VKEWFKFKEGWTPFLGKEVVNSRRKPPKGAFFS
jgi:hypothetical protein